MVNCDVVIIDSGINQYDILKVQGVCIERNCEGFGINNNLKDEIGHGTIIYSIISKHVENSNIYIVKLAYNQDYFDDSIIIYALEYIKQNVKCKIINMSLGIKTGENLSQLNRICNELSEMGVVIVSAFDNDGCYSYPATFDSVIGVDSRTDINNINEFELVESSPINILAKGNVQRIKMSNRGFLVVDGTSIACAHITSILANVITDEWDMQKALLYLKKNSRYIYPASIFEEEDDNVFFKITNAVVFPFSKEAHAFVRFAAMLPFNIVEYYDVRCSGKVGRKISSYYEATKSQKHVMDIEQINFEGIDTIILGHLDELNAISDRDYRVELINKAIAARVNIYSFDPLEQYEKLFKNSLIKHFYPRVKRNNVPQNVFGKLYKINKPVVGIFGTSSQQGKFSLQLSLKRELEYCGYDVGTVGTEPHSLLFDFDVVFPMGYNSTVSLSSSEIVLYLNNEINKLCLKGKEIILVSTQAQIVPFYCNNVLEFPTMQYHFALGTKPDAVVMCINFHDEIEYIRLSMYSLMGLTGATIIAFVMYPVSYFCDWKGAYSNAKYTITYEEYAERAQTLQQLFDIPVYLLGEKQHMERLCKDVIDFF